MYRTKQNFIVKIHFILSRNPILEARLQGIISS